MHLWPHLYGRLRQEEGRKRPVVKDVDHTFAMDKVKYTKYILSFK